MKKTTPLALLFLLLTSTASFAIGEILFVSTDSWVAPAGGGSSNSVQVLNVGVGDPIPYSISETADWITLSATIGTTPGSFTITALSNDTGQSREAVITVSAAGIAGSPKTITVTQEASGTSDSYEPDGTAATAHLILAGNDYQTRQINPASDVDFIKFEGVAGKGYIIEIAAATGGDVLFRLYNAAQAIISSDYTTRLEWICPATGSYYIRTWENGSNAVASYQIRVLPAYWNGNAYWDGNFEPDEVQTRSYLIKTDGTLYPHNNTDPKDVDWVRFTATEGRVYTIALANEVGGNFLFVLYDPHSNGISGAQTTSYTWTCPLTATYFIKTYEDGSNAAGSFNLSVTGTGGVDFAVDVPLRYATLYLDPGSGVQSYQLTADSSNCPGALGWSSSNPAAVTVSANGLLQAQGPGTAIVTATCSSAGTSDSIEVSVYANNFEPDDVQAQAAAVTVGSTYYHRSFIPKSGVNDQFDWVKFEAVAGHGYVFELSQEAGAAIYYDLYNAAGTVLVNDQSGSYEWTCPATGTYYLRFWSSSYLQYTSVRFRILPAYWNGNAQWDANGEPDSFRSLASLVKTDGTLYTHGNTYTDDLDWMRFTATAGRVYTFALSEEVGGNFMLVLFDPQGNAITGEQSTSYTWTCPMSGTYYVRVHEDNTDTIGSCKLSITVSGGPDFAVDVPLRYATLYLDPGSGVQSYQLTADSSNCPGALGWSSSNPAAVTVSANGLLQAQGPGTAIVTATCSSAGTSDSIEVSVYANNFEPDDVQAQAAAVTVGSTYYHRSFIPKSGVNDQFDWVKFEAVAGHGYVFELSQEAGAAIYYDLYNAAGTVLVNDQSGSYEWTCPATGTYYLRFWSSSYLQYTSVRFRILPAYWNGNAQWDANGEPDSFRSLASLVKTDGTLYTHGNTYTDDLDWMRFTATAGRVYTFALSEEVGGNFMLVLFDPQGNAITGEQSTSYTWTCPMSGTYYVRVHEDNTDTIGSCKLSITVSGGPDFAVDVPLRYATLYLDPGSGVQSYQLTADSSNCPGALGWSSSNPAAVTVSANGLLQAQGPGTAIVTATCSSAGTSDSIEVSVYANNFEPDDVQAQAAAVTVGSTYYHRSFIPKSGVNDQFDWVKFEAVAGHGYVFELSQEAGAAIYYDLYNAAGTVLVNDQSGSYEWTCPATGTYYLRFWSSSYLQYTSVRFRILPAYWNGNAQWDANGEPDSFRSLASLVKTDGTLYTHGNTYTDDLDWMRFTATAGRVYTFALSEEVGGNFMLVLFDPQGNAITGEQSTSYTWTCPMSGTYYVRVHEDNTDTIGSCKLSITVSGGPDFAVDVPLRYATLYLDPGSGVQSYQLTADSSNCPGALGWSSSNPAAVTVSANGLLQAQGPGTAIVTATCSSAGTSDSIEVSVYANNFEPDDVQAQAAAVTVGSTYYHRSFIPKSGVNDQFDWVKFEAVAGHGYVFELSQEAGAAIYYDLYNAAGTVLVNDQSGSYEWTCPATGTYYLRFWSSSYLQYTSVRFRILPAYWNGNAQWDANGEPDSFRSLASLVKTDGTLYTHGNTYTDDLDWMRFTATAGRVYTFALSEEVGGNFMLVLFDPQGNAITGEQSTSYTWTCPMSGTYYVRVHEDNTDTIGSCKLSITVSGGPDFAVDVPLRYATLYLDPGSGVQSYQLTADSSNCPGALGWSSSNPAAVTVSANGLLQAQGPGTAIVTATCSSAGTSDSIEVSVYANNFEPDDVQAQAAAVTVGSTYYHRSFIPKSGVNDQFDWVKFEAVAGHGYVFELSQEAGAAIYYDLYNAAGTVLVNDQSGSYEWTCPATGTYYLRFWSSSYLQYTSVRFRILPAYWNGNAQWDANGEPDSFRSLASLVKTDGTLYTHGNTYTDDLDWMRFTATAGRVYTFALSEEVGGNFMLVLFDPQGNAITGEQSTSYTWTCPMSGTYYVRVHEDNTDTIGSCKLSITVSGGPDFAVDVPLRYATLYLDPGSGVQSYQLTADSSNCPGALGWSSSNPAAVTVSANGLLQAQGPGTAIVTATCSSAGTSDSIEVSVYANNFEPDDVQAQAAAVTVGSTYYHRSFIPKSGVNDQFDWVKFEAVAGHGYVFELSQEAGAAIYYDLYNAAGTVLVNDQSGSYEWTCPATGTYYLRFWSSSYLQYTSVRFRILPAYWNDFAAWGKNYEPNDQGRRACIVCTDDSSAYYSAVHAFSEVGSDFDWYRFYAVAGASYTITLLNEIGGNFYFRIYNSSFASISSDITTTLTWVCPATGIYHVRVWEQNTDQVGAYDLRIVSVNGKPTDTDSDADGMPDCWELYYFGNGNLYRDGTGDFDGDGVTDKQEYDMGTVPAEADNDSDGDGIPDNWENLNGLNASDPTDGIQDYDNDGLINLLEFTHKTNPLLPDTDGDGIPDGSEVSYRLDPNNPSDAQLDLDHDGLSNLVEYQYKTDPNNPDTDGDGISDGDEVRHGNNPNGLDEVSLKIQNRDIVVSLTGNNTIFIELFNRFCVPKFIQVELTGLDTQYYTLAPENAEFSLLPFARKVIPIHLHLPMDCGLTTGSNSFEVAARWEHGGRYYTSTDQGNLLITPNPNIYKMAIPEKIRLAGNTILFAWKTDIPTSSYLYYRKLGDENYTQIAVATNALEHRHTIADLDWFTYYEFYTENHALCDGYAKNGPYLVKTGKAVKFNNGLNQFWIDRDYNQQVTLSITNTDLIDHTYQLSVINDNNDLVVGFVGDGSNSRQANLQPGESMDVELVIHAPDALKTLYDIYLKIVSDTDELNGYVDYSHAIIHVRPFVVNLDLQPVASSPGMMTYEVNLINYGDRLTDIEVYVDAGSDLKTWMDQEYHHLRLENGQTVPIVIHAQEHTTGTLYARSGSYIISTPFEIGCPEGTSLNTYILNNVPVVTQIKDWYCTNKERLSLPFSVPRGFGIDDIVSAFLEVNFSLPMALEKYDPHTVEIYINDHLITRLEDTIPNGLYRFRFPASFIHTGLQNPAKNYLTLVAQVIGAGQYIVATNFNIVLNLEKMEIDLCVPPPTRICPLPSGCSPPNPESRIIDVGPKTKFRPGGIVPVTVTLHNNDNHSHQGRLVVTITNNSKNAEEDTKIISEEIIIPPGSFVIPGALNENERGKFNYTISPDEDDVEYTISVTFENFTLNNTSSLSNRPAFYVRTPLIIMHGIAGSLLRNSETGESIWGKEGDFFDALIFDDPSLDQLVLNGNGTSTYPIEATKAIIKVFKSLPIVGVDVFDGLNEYLRNNNYVFHPKGINSDSYQQVISLDDGYKEDVFYFVYDWRMDNYSHADDGQEQTNTLLNLIQALTANAGLKVNIVAHSMGGLILKSLLEENDAVVNNINKVIFLGTPHLGAVKAFTSIEYGENDFSIDNDRYQRIAQNMISVHQLLPSERYFDQYPNGYYTPIEQVSPINNYADMKIALEELGFNKGLVDNAQYFHQLIDNPNLVLPDKSFNVAGCKSCTLIGSIATTNKQVSIEGDGDETVPLKSAMAVNATKKYIAQYAQHSNLPSHEGVRRIVRSILKGFDDDLPLYGIHSVTSSDFENYCGLKGVKIVIKDPESQSFRCTTCWPSIKRPECEGNSCFSTFFPNGIHLGIIGSDYKIINEGVEIYVPEGSSYILEFSGTDQSYVDLKFQLMTEGGIIKTYIFKKVTLGIDGCGQVTFNLSGIMTNPILNIDNQCDGFYEQQNLLPDYALNENESADTTPPSTTKGITGVIGANDWYISDVTLTLNATDSGGSDLLAIRYRFQEESTYTDYSGPIHLSEPGRYTLVYYAIDRNLNKEVEKILELKLDNGAPQVLSVNPSDQSNNSGRSTSIDIVFSEMMDITRLNNANVSVKGSITGLHGGSFAFDVNSNMLTFVPESPFLLQETVTVKLSGDLTDMVGIGFDGNGDGYSQGSPADDYVWSFEVEDSDGLIVRIQETDTACCPTVRASLIVTDDAGMPVTDLNASDFMVLDNNSVITPVHVTFIDQIDSPMSVSIALDFSNSMSAAAIADMKSAAVDFINNMLAKDAGEIIKFARGVETTQPFTSEKTALINAVYSATSLVTSATALCDAAFLAVNDSSTQQSRKAVVVMTGGNNNFGSHTAADVIALARSTGVPVFIIGLGSNIDVTLLSNIAKQTGGIYYEAPTSAHLKSIYEAISNVLKNHYILTFRTDDPNGQAHRLQIVADNGTSTGSHVATFTACLDLDSDGLQDEWEQYIVDANSQDPINSILDILPWGDLDGDGFSNMREFLFGSNPLSAVSVPGCTSDYSFDLDVDGEDLSILADDLQQGECFSESLCVCEWERNGQVPGILIRFMAEDFGRMDCH